MYELPPCDDTKTTSKTVVVAVGAALYQWKARNEQELSFARGDVIEVLEQGEMRWRGRLQKNKYFGSVFGLNFERNFLSIKLTIF